MKTPWRRSLAALMALTVAAPAGAGAKGKPAPEAVDENQIVHVLNRLGYGPRPGDVETVKRLGLRAWIDQQLHPERISDAALAARL
ncbi:MAG TPA: DUF1800 family protein, partial [Vicinamibacteria bacterium]